MPGQYWNDVSSARAVDGSVMDQARLPEAVPSGRALPLWPRRLHALPAPGLVGQGLASQTLEPLGHRLLLAPQRKVCQRATW